MPLSLAAERKFLQRITENFQTREPLHGTPGTRIRLRNAWGGKAFPFFLCIRLHYVVSSDRRASRNIVPFRERGEQGVQSIGKGRSSPFFRLAGQECMKFFFRSGPCDIQKMESLTGFIDDGADNAPDRRPDRAARTR